MKARNQGRQLKGWGLVILLGMIVAEPSGFAREPKPDWGGEKLRIVLRIYNYAQLSPTALRGAADQATAVFRQAGIEALWLGDPRSSQEAWNGTAPEASLEPADFAVRIVASSDLYPPTRTVMGFTMLCATESSYCVATVFYPRALALATQARTPVAQVLGRAIAHEVDHVLLATLSHSQDGIMRVGWRAKDFAPQSAASLLFTSEDAVQIAAAVRQRMRNHAPRLQAKAMQ